MREEYHVYNVMFLYVYVLFSVRFRNHVQSQHIFTYITRKNVKSGDQKGM